MKKVYRSLIKTASVILLLMSCLSAYAQERVLTGKIVDATGTAMPGVNVIKKGTATGGQCCGSEVEADVNCTGTTSDDSKVTITVRGTSSAPTCASYSIAYHY